MGDVWALERGSWQDQRGRCRAGCCRATLRRAGRAAAAKAGLAWVKTGAFLTMDGGFPDCRGFADSRQNLEKALVQVQTAGGQTSNGQQTIYMCTILFLGRAFDRTSNSNPATLAKGHVYFALLALFRPSIWDSQGCGHFSSTS